MTPVQDRLWAPWRTPYITQARSERARCIFCFARRSRDDRKVHVVLRGRCTFVVLNRYPYNPGHLLVAPCRHVGTLTRLTAEENAELLQTAGQMIERLTQIMKPHGFNCGINLGRVAGAGIPGHLHLHLVPRWPGDTNFMPVIGKTKVISQSLDALYERLTRRRMTS